VKTDEATIRNSINLNVWCSMICLVPSLVQFRIKWIVWK